MDRIILMAIQTFALASGSSGNCFFYEANNQSFLIDAGISAKQICERLSYKGKNILNIEGIFITHEHVDHIQGLKVLSKRYEIPIYITQGTYNNCPTVGINSDIHIIRPDKEIDVGGIAVLPFKKSHDAAEPVSFSFTWHGKTISFITDLGIADERAKEQVGKSDALFLEANYDPDMLHNGRYPYPVKARIQGTNGHLSNYDASLLALEHAQVRLKYLMLSHLSQNNNTSIMALQTFKEMLKERKDLEKLDVDISTQREISKSIIL
jgi:phosphoribosyl 1,2-cyclic phosphodiesterase